MAAFLLYATLSIVRHATFRSTGFDLGLFDQVVWHLANLDAPASSLKGLDSILGDHFSPVLALVAPVRVLWPSPDALLVTQAALVAASGLPVHLFTRARFGERVSLAVCGAYLAGGSLQAGVWFDFHEVAFAPLLIALAVLFSDRGQRGRALVAALALLLVKEDMAFVVVAMGGYFALVGLRREALVVVVAGVGWYLAVTELVIPAAAGGAAYRYWTYDALGSDLGDAAWNILRRPWRILEVATDASEKLRTTAYLLGAWLGLSLLSPVVLLAVPLLAARMLSSNPQYWTMEGHYSLALAPVLALAAVDGLARLRRRLPERRSRRLPALAAGGFVAIAVLVTPAFPGHRLLLPDSYRTPADYRAADEALALVPPGASVAATNRIVPHLADRDDVVLLGPTSGSPEFVVASTTDGDPAATFPNPDLASVRRLVDGLRARYDVVLERDGIVVLRRRAPGGAPSAVSPTSAARP